MRKEIKKTDKRKAEKANEAKSWVFEKKNKKRKKNDKHLVIVAKKKEDTNYQH